MNRKTWALLTLFGFLCLMHKGFAQQQEQYPFEKEVLAFQHKDAEQEPPKNGILFVGSSSIRLWDDLEQRFGDKPIIKRGVGGCQLHDFVQYYMDKLVYPYQASQLFVYAGDNDIANGRSAEEVAQTFRQFFKQVRARQADIPIYFLAIKPSNSRAQYIPVVEKANTLIKKFLKKQKNGTFVDVASVILGPDGTPDDSLFKEDRLHLNSKGYDRWEAVIRPLLN